MSTLCMRQSRKRTSIAPAAIREYFMRGEKKAANRELDALTELCAAVHDGLPACVWVLFSTVVVFFFIAYGSYRLRDNQHINSTHATCMQLLLLMLPMQDHFPLYRSRHFDCTLHSRFDCTETLGASTSRMRRRRRRRREPHHLERRNPRGANLVWTKKSEKKETKYGIVTPKKKNKKNQAPKIAECNSWSQLTICFNFCSNGAPCRSDYVCGYAFKWMEREFKRKRFTFDFLKPSSLPFNR